MTEITRELLEHYLRATEWTRRARHYTCPIWERGDGGIPDTWLEGEMQDAAISTITVVENRSRQAIGMRLGLCAAAESCLAAAISYAAAADAMPDHPGARRDALMAEGTEREAATRLFNMAGVDQKLWEEARHRS